MKFKFLQYLIEIKFRFTYIFISFIFSLLINIVYFNQISYVLIKPIIQLSGISNYIYTNIEGMYFIYMHLIFLSSIFYIVPIIILNIYIFLLSSLYKYEYNYMKSIFYIINIYILYIYYNYCFIFLPKAIQLFLNYQIIGGYEYIFSFSLELILTNYIWLIYSLFIGLFFLHFIIILLLQVFYNSLIIFVLINKIYIYLLLIILITLFCITINFSIIIFLSVSLFLLIEIYYFVLNYLWNLKQI